MIAAGSFFIFMAFFMFLPVIVLVPQKFAISFTIGSIFIVGSFFALKGPKAQFYHMVSKEVNIESPISSRLFHLMIIILRGSCFDSYQVMCFITAMHMFFVNCVFWDHNLVSINVFNVNFFVHIQRWAFTAGFIGSMAATIYVSVVLHSYILSVVFAVVQVCICTSLFLLYEVMWWNCQSIAVYDACGKVIWIFSLYMFDFQIF